LVGLITLKLTGCFNRRVVLLVADKLKRQWLTRGLLWY